VLAKLDKNGLRAVASPVKSGGVKQTRVRVGPFSARDAADTALEKVKHAGEKNAVIVTLEK
jgi:cell division protein FtsN